ncbi:MAG: PAS domain-containing sensor histidine kinase [Deltaproteobacteria bacterium]|nr:PAS domain-containing sensor histidine kinase [Deltaproteobacteria bacterium]
MTKTHDARRANLDPAALMHALEVHQTELEVQNSELQTANAELRQSNDALVIARDRFHALYDLAPIPYVTVDIVGIIVDLNRAAELILGAPRTRLIGGPIALFVDDDSRERFRVFVATVFSAGHARCAEIGLQRSNAPPATAQIDGVVLREAASDGPRCVLAIVDITARKQAETARRKAQDEVLAIVSHDLRGPLNAIGLACDALASGLDASDHHDCVSAIERAAGRCERLIKDLLGVAHIESGRLKLELAPFDLRDLVRQVCRDLATTATAAGSALTMTLPDDRAELAGDRDRMYQVLANLIGNAMVHARGAAIEVSVAVRPRQLVLAVTDRGPGITADELPLVFERYRQGTRHHGGAGLGLAIVKGLAEAHGGTATVTSKVGQGARFEITLPRGDARD